VKMSSGANPHNTSWRDLLASKGLSGAALVLEGYGLSCENDLSLLVQEDLNTLSSQLKQVHSRILRTWVQGLASEDEHHKRDKNRAAGDAMNDGPGAKKHSNSPPSAETQEQEGTKQIAKEDEDEEVEDEDEDEEDTGDEDECSAISIYLP
jgi:hypothetical protein